MIFQIAPTLSTTALEPWLWLAADVLLGFAVVRQASAYLALRSRPRPTRLELGLPAFATQITLVRRRVEQLIADAQYGDAVRFAYLETLASLVSLCGVQPPPSATHRELLTEHLSSLPSSLRESASFLYQVYEPYRYGGAPSTAAHARLVLDVLQRLASPPKLAGDPIQIG